MVIAENYLIEMKNQKILPNIATYNTLINKYVNDNNITKVNEILKEMKKNNIPPNIKSFNTLIIKYSNDNNIIKFDKLLNEMKNEYNIKFDYLSYKIIINFYIKIKNYNKINELIEEILNNKINFNKKDINFYLINNNNNNIKNKLKLLIK
jgi:pentatricopeptide repeat protein